MDLLKQFQPAVSPEQTQACQTVFGKAAPAACTDATKALAAEIYSRIKVFPTSATKAAPAPSPFFTGLAAIAERHRQPKSVLFVDDTLTAHAANLGQAAQQQRRHGTEWPAWLSGQAEKIGGR